MLPTLLFQVALLIITVHSLYTVFKLAGSNRKPWFDILYHRSIAVLGLHFLL